MNLASIIDPHPDDAVALDLPRAQPPPTASCASRWPACAAGSPASGLEPGDRVAIIAANNWYFVVSYLAVLGAGCVAVPLNPIEPGARAHARAGRRSAPGP